MDENVNIILQNDLQLIIEGEDEYKRIDSALVLNPSLTWIKFILTDDQPNGNNFRIDKSAFPSIIKSGIYMPIKMADGRISEGHDGTTPIGVITDLIEDGNKIKGIGVLWGEERPEEINLLKQYYSEGKPINISWELLYRDFETEGNVTTAKSAVLLAATIVGRPAYAGRTPVLEMAEQIPKEEEQVETTNDLKELYEKVLSEKELVSQELNSYKQKVEELEKAMAELQKELDLLKEYKETREKEDAENQRFESIKSKFSEAGIELDEEYFSSKREYLLSMNDEVLEFFIKELMMAKKPEEASLKKPQVPNFTRQSVNTELSPVELARKLKEIRNKEK